MPNFVTKMQRVASFRIKKPGPDSRFLDRFSYALRRIKKEKPIDVLNRVLPEDRAQEILDGAEPTVSELRILAIDAHPITSSYLLSGTGPVSYETPKAESYRDRKGMNHRFYQLRIRHNETQEEWANHFNRGRSTIASIENNTQSLSIDMLRILRHKFNIPYDWIIDGASVSDEQMKFAELQDTIDRQEEMIKRYEVFIDSYLRSKSE